MKKIPLITVTIAGPQGSGKSRLETMLLDALLNAGADKFDQSFSTVTGETTEKCRYLGADIHVTTTQETV